jgi:catechol 2,3-dioxygenase-like lactoylglutathione lyase family enzyme
MFDLPKPKLAEVSGLTINTPDLNASVKFYERLGFSELFRGDFPFPLVELTDGQIQIMLRHTPEKYFALTYYPKDIDAVAADLAAEGIEPYEKAIAESDYLKFYRMKTPDGFVVSMVMYFESFSQPQGPTMLTMLTMPQTDYFNPEKYTNKTAGMLGEIAHPVKDLDASIAYWQKLGFTVLSKFESPYPWAIISDGLNAVGLHQTTEFDYPALTYFASDMAEKIEKLKAAGLSNFTEKSPGNIVLNTPEGQHVNLFKLGM